MEYFDLELWLVSATLGGALAYIGLRVHGAALALTLGVAGLLAPWPLASVWREARPLEESEVRNRPVQLPPDRYVSSDACVSCHPGEYDSWKHSFHRSMTQPATAESILGDFNETNLTLRGESYRMFRRDGGFWIERPGAGQHRGERIAAPVVMATGSHHYQLYWLPAGGGREVVLFEFAWRIADQRWMPVDAIFVHPPGERQAIREKGRWNNNCVRCHTTVPHADEDGIHLAEFGIGCEACHGPGLEHVEINRDPIRRLAQRWQEAPDPTITNPADLAPKRAAQVCGQCHGLTAARRGSTDGSVASGYHPGDDLFSTRRLFRGPAPEYFWSDGVVRVSGREFNGLAASPCYAHDDPERGIMTCLNCHEMHPNADDPRTTEEWRDDQLSLGGNSNTACLECHGEFVAAADLIAHTNHGADSAGSECANCHMPHSTYGLLKAMRSHTIESPDVRVDARTGRPNACNLCHMDQTLGWTASHLSAWYGRPMPRLDADQRSVAAGALWGLRGDAGQRALAAWSMGWQPARDASAPGWMEPILAQMLTDSYTAVRYIANRSLQLREGYEQAALEDVMLPLATRLQLRDRAWHTWREASVAAATHSSAVLLREDGTLDGEAYLRLVAAQDQRPVALAE